jgi:hypothetical protein
MLTSFGVRISSVLYNIFMTRVKLNICLFYDFNFSISVGIVRLRTKGHRFFLTLLCGFVRAYES